MPRYLVSGIAALVSDVAAVLREHDAEVVEVDDLADVPTVCADAGPASFDGYVQLPATFTVQGETAVQRVHHFFAEGVLARFPAVAAALPSLKPDARLTFVTGVLPQDVSTEDDVAARAALSASSAGPRRPMRRTGCGSAPSAPAPRPRTSRSRPWGAAPTPGRSRPSPTSTREWRIELLGMMWAET